MGKGVGKSIARSSALGWLGGLLASGLARRRQKTKRQGRVWPTLVQLVQRFPVPGPRRPSREAKQEGGGPGLVQHSIAVRAVHQLKRRDPLSIQPLSQRTRSRFSLALGTPASCNARNKDTCCGHQIISTKAGPVCQRGCNLISISGVFYRINIWTRKNHKDKATP